MKESYSRGKHFVYICGGRERNLNYTLEYFDCLGTYPNYVTDEHTQSYGERYFVSSMFLSRVSHGKYGENQHKREKELNSKGLGTIYLFRRFGHSQVPVYLRRCQAIQKCCS